MLSLILELIKTDKTIAKVCEEQNVRPTDYPELYEITEAIDDMKGSCSWKELKKELSQFNIDADLPEQFLQIEWKKLRRILKEHFKELK